MINLDTTRSRLRHPRFAFIDINRKEQIYCAVCRQKPWSPGRV
uniref:Uncharacterized protein n=1 Tax=Anguilla anguilla TaxID=7936 RepID=A0A0E9VBI4_ANGAN